MTTKSSKSKSQSDADGVGPRYDADVRERAREITSQALGGGRIDPDGMREFVRSVTSGAGSGTDQPAADVKQALADAVQALDDSLVESAQAAHLALQQLATKGADFTDNDLKDTLTKLRKLQEAYVATVTQVSNAASGNIERELRDLAKHVQGVSVDVGAQVATVMTEFASRLSSATSGRATSGFDAMRDAGVRTMSVASGVLAGIADALREQSSPDKSK